MSYEENNKTLKRSSMERYIYSFWSFSICLLWDVEKHFPVLLEDSKPCDLSFLRFLFVSMLHKIIRLVISFSYNMIMKKEFRRIQCTADARDADETSDRV